MLDLQGDVFRAAVGTFPAPLRQQVFPHLVAEERALLVFDAFDLRVLKGLGIEVRQFLADRRDRRQPGQALEPGHRGLDPMAQGRREPALGPGPVLEARRPVAQLAAPPPAEYPPCGQPVPNDRAPML